jgi:dolichyl-phosphate-mannose--protein O-mannosyl transferase
MIVGGAVLRIQGFGAPSFYTFDEELFAKNAHNYLLGAADVNDHPPLGKLVMAVGMVLFGYSSVGWRFASVCFGLQTILIAFLLARALFEDARRGWFAAAFVAADGFFIAHSRAGLLDGMLACLVLWSVLLAVTARGWAGVLASAVMVGLATSVKWSGIAAVVPAAAAVLFLGRARKLDVLLFAVVPVVHVALWSYGLYITGQPHDLPAVWDVMVRLFKHHVEMGHNYNALASPWYTWLGLYHPIVVKLAYHGFSASYAAEIGNPLTWFTGVLVAIGVPVLALVSTFWSRARRLFHHMDPATRRGLLILALGWFALLTPWIVGRGKYTFMYHYLPSHGFALLLAAGFVAMLERRRPAVALGLTAVTLCIAVYFAPVWGEFSLSESAANHRLLFPTWRP